MGWTCNSTRIVKKCRWNFDGKLTESGFFEDPEGDGRAILKLRFEVLMRVAIKIIISWNVTPYYFVGRYCLLRCDAVLFGGQVQYENFCFLGYYVV
jgi:hypothetical protein